VLAAFIEDRCVVHSSARVGASVLWEAYKEWCELAGEDKGTQNKFGRRLGERGYEKRKEGLIYWYGIGLRDDRPDPGPDEGSKGPVSDLSPSNRPTEEPRIDKPNAGDSGGEPGPFGPKNDIDGL
jgi:phage/plasmid-associated DNA primase